VYEIKIYSNTDLSQLADSATVDTSVYDIAILPDGVFYWRVRGLSGNSEPGLWSEVWHFTLDTTTPDLIAPLNGTITNDATPTFEWEEVVDATRDNIQIDDDPAFGSPRYETNVLNTTWTPSIGLGDGTWYWQVRAQPPDNSWSEWSTSWSVTIDRVRPARVVLTAPTMARTSLITRQPSPGNRWWMLLVSDSDRH
jgi:hypothetical protein